MCVGSECAYLCSSVYVCGLGTVDSVCSVCSVCGIVCLCVSSGCGSVCSVCVCVVCWAPIDSVCGEEGVLCMHVCSTVSTYSLIEWLYHRHSCRFCSGRF